MNTIDPRIKLTLTQILRWLVSGDYAAIERFTTGVRLSALILQKTIADYGRILVMPPDYALDQIDVIEVQGASSKTWSVRVDLWTKEEGRSDLSLECTLVDQLDELLSAEVDNLHVL